MPARRSRTFPRPAPPILVRPRAMYDGVPSSDRERGNLAAYLQNVMPAGDDLVNRPGLKSVGGPGLSIPHPLVTNGVGYITTRMQALLSIPRGSGLAPFLFAYVGGRPYLFTPETASWAVVPGLVGGGFMADPSQERVALVAFGGALNAPRIIASDGTNQPWWFTLMANGTIQDGGRCTGASPWYGPPVVRSAKLFGIRADDRRTVEWSEEGDPNAGYGVGDNENTWTLIQSGVDLLVGLAATEDGLYYGRRTSIGVILGDSNLDFRGATTQDAVSQGTGFVSPWAQTVYGRSVYFVDQNGRPGVVDPGAGVTLLDDAVEETLAKVDEYTLQRPSRIWSTSNPDLGVIVFGIPFEAASQIRYTSGEVPYPSKLLVYHAGSRDCHGIWIHTAGGTPFALGVPGAIDASGREHLLLLDHAGAVRAMALHGPRSRVDHDDDGVAIECVVRLRPLGSSAEVERQFDRLDLVAAFTMLATDAQIERQRTYALGFRLPGAEIAPGGPRAITLVPPQSVGDFELKGSIGLQRFARWLAPIVTGSALGKRSFSLIQVRLDSYQLTDEPKVR